MLHRNSAIATEKIDSTSVMEPILCLPFEPDPSLANRAFDLVICRVLAFAFPDPIKCPKVIGNSKLQPEPNRPILSRLAPGVQNSFRCTTLIPDVLVIAVSARCPGSLDRVFLTPIRRNADVETGCPLDLDNGSLWEE